MKIYIKFVMLSKTVNLAARNENLVCGF